MRSSGRRRGAARTAPPAGIRPRLDRFAAIGACAAFWLAIIITARNL